MGLVLKPDDLAIIAPNFLLPAPVGPGEGLSALWPARDILWILLMGGGFCLRVELGDVELAGDEIFPIVTNKRCIGTNRVPSTRRYNSWPVEEASNSEGGAAREMKPGIDLIIIDQFDLVGGVGGDILALNVTENTNELPGVLALLTVTIGSFAELL